MVKRETEKQGIQSIELGVGVLMALRIHGELGLNDLAHASGMSASKAYRYLVSFGRTGLSEQDASTGRYRLGPMALELGLARMARNDALRVAMPELSELTRVTETTSTLSVWGNMGPTVVRWEESRHIVNVNLRVGSVLPLTTTATGLVFAAWRPASQMEPLMRQELAAAPRRGSSHTFAGLQRRLAEIRRQGCAAIDGTLFPGICALSAPVFDHDGHVVLAMSVMGHTGTLDVSPKGAVATALCSATQRVSASLGMPPLEGAAQIIPA